MRKNLTASLIIISFFYFNSLAADSEEPVTIEAHVINPFQDSLARIEYNIKMGKNVYIFAGKSRSFEVKITKNEGAGEPEIELPRSKRRRNPDNTTEEIYTGSVKIVITFRPEKLPWNIQGYLQYQACDKARCFFPKKKCFDFSSNNLSGAIERLSDCPVEKINDSESDNR